MENQLIISSDTKASDLHDWVAQCFKVPPASQVYYLKTLIDTAQKQMHLWNTIHLYLCSPQNPSLCSLGNILPSTLIKKVDPESQSIPIPRSPF